MGTRGLSALCMLALLLAGFAAGCGGRSSASGTTTATAAATGTTGVEPSAQTACRHLNTAARSVVGRIGATLAGFEGITSVGSLKTHVARLRGQLDASAARIDAISTPSGKLTRDRDRLASALHGLSREVAKAQRAAAAGRIGAATSGFSSAAQLTQLRGATEAIGRDCPRVP